MKRAFFLGCAAIAAFATHAGAQIIRDHRTNPGGTFTVHSQWPGDFAFRAMVTKQFLSATGSSVGSSTTLGPSSRFRIVETSTAGEYNLFASNGSQVAFRASSTPGGPIVGSLGVVPAGGPQADDKAFRFTLVSGTQAGSYVGSYRILPKGHDTWQLQQDLFAFGTQAGVTGPAFTNLPENAQKFYAPLKCGDLGSGFTYRVTPVGAPKPAFGGNLKLLREADGTYVLETTYTGSIQNKRMIVSGGGGFASNNGAPGGYNIDWGTATTHPDWQKVRLVDQGNCTYTIQTPKNWILGVKDGHWSTRLDNPTAAAGIGYTAVFELWPVF